MPRTISTVSNPDPTDIALPLTVPISSTPLPWIADFPDLRKPVGSGSWSVKTQLSTDSPCPVEVLVELLQDQRQIGRGYVSLASHRFTITSVPTDYGLSIGDISQIVMGRCHVSKLKVRLTPTEECSSSSSSSASSTSSDSSSSQESSSSSTSSVSSSSTSSTSSDSSGSSSSSGGGGCCSGVPDHLTLSVTGCINLSVALTAQDPGTVWEGTDSAGRIWRFGCLFGVWSVTCANCDIGGDATSVSCSPFMITFSLTADSEFGSCPPCDNSPVSITVTA